MFRAIPFALVTFLLAATAGLAASQSARTPTDAEIKRAITQGVRRDGTKLKPPMSFASYAKMTDDDLRAIYVYTRTLKPISNQVPQPLPPAAD